MMNMMTSKTSLKYNVTRFYISQCYRKELLYNSFMKLFILSSLNKTVIISVSLIKLKCTLLLHYCCEICIFVGLRIRFLFQQLQAR